MSTSRRRCSASPGSRWSDTAEGRFVNIRGLDSDLNGVSFDGVRLMPSNVGSPFGGGRAIALDAIPAGFVGGLEVVKTQRPDQDAEALGGSINVIPREPRPDGQPSLDLNIGGGYEPLRDTPVVQGGLTFSGTFGRGQVAVHSPPRRATQRAASFRATSHSESLAPQPSTTTSAA